MQFPKNIEYKWIPNFRGSYKASSRGEIISYKRKEPFVMRNQIGSNGRLQVKLSSNGKSKNYGVARLVLLAFIRFCPKGHEASHLDGNRVNNDLGNLMWETHADNAKRMKLHGTSLIGTKNPMNKLSTKIVIEIRRLRGEMSQRDIAKKYGVCQSHVHRIQTLKEWSHV